MKWICYLLMAGFIISCSDKSNDNDAVGNSDTTHFYPLKQFVEEQISEIRRTPYQINKYVVEAGKKDSAIIDTTEFIRLARQFITPDISDKKNKRYYKETVFEDQSTQSIVLSYAPIEDKLPVKSINVMLSNQNQQLKRIDIIKVYDERDSSFEERLAWLPDSRFQIIQIITKGESELTRQTNVVWNDRY